MNKIKNMMLVCLVLLSTLALYGCQKKNVYTVSFDSNGGTKVAKQEIKKDEKVKEPDTPIKEGYTFKGWYLDGKKYDFNKKVKESFKLKAKWSKKTSESLNDTVYENNSNHNYLSVKNNYDTIKPVEVIAKKEASVYVSAPLNSYALEQVNFSVSTIMNDYKDTDAYLKISVSNREGIEIIEYLDLDGNWNALDEDFKQNIYGDTENKYRVIFNESGIYEFNFVLYESETDKVLKTAEETMIVLEALSSKVSTDLKEKIVVGKTQEFNVTTTANDNAGLMVVGCVDIDNYSKVKLEYLGSDDNWYELKSDDVFGNSEGFKLTDATSKFRVTFNELGTYNAKIEILNVLDNSLVAHENLTIDVEKALIEVDDLDNVVVGEETDFDVSTVVGEENDTMVIGTWNFDDYEAIEKLEYLGSDNNWYELKLDDVFGNSEGFKLTDATSKFRVTFNKVGTYNAKIEILNVLDNSLVLDKSFTVTVKEDLSSNPDDSIDEPVIEDEEIENSTTESILEEEPVLESEDNLSSTDTTPEALSEEI